MSFSQKGDIESGSENIKPTSTEYGPISTDPNEQLGFEIEPQGVNWSFVPEFYPDRFTQMKKRELNRYGAGCGTESVSIKSEKNREFHATGVVLHEEVETFQYLMDFSNQVDLISPLTPVGGIECFVKKAELGQEAGWDPVTRQRMFEFTIDLVSTGRDERDSNENSIITAIIDESQRVGESDTEARREVRREGRNF